jgi:hypothetical protein
MSPAFSGPIIAQWWAVAVPLARTLLPSGVDSNRRTCPASPHDAESVTARTAVAKRSQRQADRSHGIAGQTLRLKLRELGLHVTLSVEADEDL